MYKELRTQPRKREGWRRNEEPGRGRTEKRQQPVAGVSDGPIASLASVRARGREPAGEKLAS